MSDYANHAADRRSSILGLNEPGTTSEPAPTEPLEPVQATAAAATRRKTSAPTSTKEDFTGASVPLQVKLPQDLIQSLKLHSISSGKTMSEMVLDCLTSGESIGKAWVSTRRAG